MVFFQRGKKNFPFGIRGAAIDRERGKVLHNYEEKACSVTFPKRGREMLYLVYSGILRGLFYKWIEKPYHMYLLSIRTVKGAFYKIKS